MTRRRVAFSAYACDPTEGSEPGAGWEWLLAAATTCDLHVFTRENNIAQVEEALARRCVDAKVIGIEPDRRWRLLKRWPGGLYAYYIAWQWEVRSKIREQHAKQPFDVAHHVTFAMDWLPAGAVGIPGLPSVWGPVGGATRTPPNVLRWLGARGAVAAVARNAVTSVGRRLVGLPLSRAASVTVVQNPDGAAAFARSARRLVERPNAVVHVHPENRRIDNRRLVFAGRLVAWKGCAVAIRAIADLPDEWTLDVCGDGPDLARLRRLARRLGVAGRVQFRGRVDRGELLRNLSSAHALVFPSFHDSAPWVVAEAATLGCPVVCLDLGGPPVLAAEAGVVVAYDGAGLPRRVADAVALVAGRPRTTRWTRDEARRAVAAWYDAAADPARRGVRVPA